MISIASLIYRSPRYADSLYSSLIENTIELTTGEAEFYFVANDATREVLAHLDERGIPYVENWPPHLTDDELFAAGYGKPSYIARVYHGWNAAIKNAQDVVVLVSSDHVFAPGWLTALSSKWDEKLILSSLTIEPGPNVFPGHINGTGAIKIDCGRHPDEFDRARFLQFKSRGISNGGAHQPVMFSREKAIEAGLYPCGNLAGKSFNHVVGYGDRVFFSKLKTAGVNHFTIHESLAYHFHEGEMRE